MGAVETAGAALLADFHLVFNDFPVGMSVLSEDRRFVRVNPAICTLLGRSEALLLGEDVVGLTHPDDREALSRRLEDLLEGRRTSSQDVERRLRPDGAVVEVVVRRSVVRDGAGTRWVLQQAVATAVEQAEASVARSDVLVRLWERLFLTPGEPRDVAALAVDLLIEALGGGATVWLVDRADGTTLEAVAVRAHRPAGDEELRRLYALTPQSTTHGLMALAAGAPGAVLLERPFAGGPSTPEFLPWLRENPIGQLVLVPLRSEGRLVGVLGLGRGEEGPPFGPDEVATADRAAERLAPVLERAERAAGERAGWERSRALAAVGQACDEAVGDPRSVLQAAADAVTAVSGGTALLWVDDDRAALLGRYALGTPDLDARALAGSYLADPLPDGLVGRALGERTVHLAAPSEVERLADRHPSSMPRSPLPPGFAAYGVRLEVRGGVLGVLGVLRPEGPLAAEQRHLVDALAERVAVSLDNAALLATARQQTAQQEALAEIGATALGDGPPDRLFTVAAAAVARVLDLPRAGICRLRPDGAYDVLGRTDHGASSAAVATFPAPPGSGLGVLSATGQPVVVPDYRLRDVVDETSVVEAYGVLSGALLPLRCGADVWGALTAHSTVLRRFTRPELDFLGTVAAVISGALARSAVEERALHQAAHDTLTGLPNRLRLRAAVEDALRRRGGRLVALLLLDVDDFKDVNDSLGHEAGDEVLTRLAERLDAAVGGAGLLARLGGDEFAVLLPACETERDAAVVADRVVAALRAPLPLAGLEVALTASIGIAVAPTDGSDPEQLLQRADMAMYRAKARRSGWAFHDAALDGERGQRLALLTDLRAVLHGRGLTLHYQPLVHVGTGEVAEVEALVRWEHPHRGQLMPETFIPLAEQTGLIADLTLHVAETALRQAELWRDAGTPVGIAVNVSPVALADADVVRALRVVLTAGRGLLSVEITESALVDEAARQAVVQLAASGVRCAVDDFGTGYSALASLQSLPVSRLKLDRAFTRRVDVDPRAATVVGGAVRLAHDLGLDVVAEGVETAPVLAALRRLDVDVAQGYLYGHPCAAEQLRLTRQPVEVRPSTAP